MQAKSVSDVRSNVFILEHRKQTKHGDFHLPYSQCQNNPPALLFLFLNVQAGLQYLQIWDHGFQNLLVTKL